MVKIKCLSSYLSRFKDQPIAFAAGFEGEVTAEIADFLGRDSPGSFEFGSKAPDAPSKDKMISKPIAKKSVSELKELLREKDLPIGGNKAALVARLEEANA